MTHIDTVPTTYLFHYSNHLWPWTLPPPFPKAQFLLLSQIKLLLYFTHPEKLSPPLNTFLSVSFLLCSTFFSFTSWSSLISNFLRRLSSWFQVCCRSPSPKKCNLDSNNLASFQSILSLPFSKLLECSSFQNF